MKALGFCLQKNYLKFAVVSGTKVEPILGPKGRLPTTDPTDVKSLMDWYETQFGQLIAEHKPDVLAYKVTLEPKLEQQHHLSFPLGILNLTAQRQGLPVYEFSTSGITPKKLGLPKGTDLRALVDSRFGTHPPYWDRCQQEAILVAWFCL